MFACCFEGLKLMEMMKRNKRIFLVAVVIAVFIYIYISSRTESVNRKPKRKVKNGHSVDYYKHNLTTNYTFLQPFTEQEFLHENSKSSIELYLRGNRPSFQFDPADLKTRIEDFNIEEDVLVYLHIQKVGGTSFNEHLLRDLELDQPCDCVGNVLTTPCHCFTKGGNLWLFSWFTVGWPCGLHADWTQLQECVDEAVNEIEGKKRKRRYFYITLLRDPVKRYVSEWSHQRKGHHWEETKLFCNGERVSLFDVQPCFNTPTWEDVTFNDFMECRFNLATNRMTRMLADLRKAKCYHRNLIKPKEHSKIIMESALDNLHHISFVGITEFQVESRKLFEQTFGLKFKKEFRFEEDPESFEDYISARQYAKMMQYIELDVQLYLYARELFLKRVDSL